MNAMLTRPVVARKIAPWPSFRNYNWVGNTHKARHMGDLLIPRGYKHTSLETIPKDHVSYGAMQDSVEEIKRRNLRKEAPGRRRDYMREDLDFWIANGRPTYSSAPHRSLPRSAVADLSPRRTWRAGKPVSADFRHDYDKSLIRQYVAGRTVR